MGGMQSRALRSIEGQSMHWRCCRKTVNCARARRLNCCNEFRGGGLLRSKNMQPAQSVNETAREFERGWPVVLTAALGVGVGAPIFALGIFIAPLSKQFGWTRAQVSLASACIVFGTVVTAMFVGRIVDRLGARKMAIGSLPAITLAYIGMTQISGNIYTFYGGLVLLSLAACGASPIIWTRGVALWFEKQRGLALGITLSGAGLAAVVIPPFIGSLIARFNWQAGYLGLAVITALATIPVTFFFKEPGDTAGAPKSGTGKAAQVTTGLASSEAFRERQFWQLGVANFLVTCATASLLVHLVPLLTDAGIGRSVAAELASLMGITMIIGRFSTGYLLDRFHPPRVGSAYLLVAGVGTLMLEVTLPDLLGTATAVATFGLAAGAELEQVSFITARYFGLQAYGRNYAAQFIIFQLAVGMGPMLAGRIFDLSGSYLMALHLCAGAFFGGSVLIALLGKPRDRVHTASLSPLEQTS
jgi:predicted MFS family arabinose efflux permease